jgi:hypothetical protein
VLAFPVAATLGLGEQGAASPLKVLVEQIPQPQNQRLRTRAATTTRRHRGHLNPA